MLKYFLLTCLAFLLSTQIGFAMPQTITKTNAPKTAYDFSFMSIDETTALPLKNFEGKVLLVVNTASLCGFTAQYDGLQKIYDTYKNQGLVVIGVPSDDFGGQEPENNGKIKDFCNARFKIKFPLTQKYHVKGKNAHAFYAWAASQAGFMGAPKWNFHKYLIGRQGQFIDWFASTTTPESAQITKAIEKALKE